MTLKKIEITETKSFDFIRYQLSCGITLSKLLLNTPINEGKVFAIAPDDLEPERLLNFEGLYPFDKEILKTTNLVPVRNDSVPIVLDEIIIHLNSSDTACCLFEDILSSPENTLQEYADINPVSLNNAEVFYFFNKKNCERQKIEKALKTSQCYWSLFVQSYLELTQQTDLHSRILQMDTLESFVQNVKSFFVSAYDMESYLMWERQVQS